MKAAHPSAAFAWLAFPMLALLLFPGVLLGGRTFFFYDTGLQNLTFRAWWFEQLRAGHFAAWCPGMFAGYPLFAETQTGPLYPPTFLLFSLLPATLAFSWSVGLHFAFAGLGAFLLARRCGTGVTAALLAGVGFELSGFLVTHLVHFNLLTGAAWTPWVAWLTLRAADGRPRDALFLAAAFACLLLGAHPYATLMCVLLAAVLLTARAGASAGRLAAAVAGLAGVVALGIALAAVQVLPAQELIARSPRAEAVDWSFLTFGSFGIRGLPTLIAPDVFGTPVTGTFWGGPDWSHFAETCAFAGAMAVALAVAALVLRRDLATAAFGGLGALSFVLMLGRFTPLYHVLAWIPVVRSTRLPARFSLLLTLSIALLAGMGLDALQREPDARRRRVALSAGAAAVLALAVAAGLAMAPVLAPADPALAATGRAWSVHFADLAVATRSTAIRLAGVTAATLLALLPFARRRPPSWAGVAPLVVLTVDLLSWGRGFNPTVPASVLLSPPPAVAALPDAKPRPRIFRQGLDEMWERAPGIPRTDFVTPGWRDHEATYASAPWSMPPNSQLLWGVDSGEGFTSLPPADWLEWMGLPARPGASPRPDLTEAQADLLSLDAVLSSGSGIDGAQWQSRALPGDLYLSRNLDRLPRVRFATSWTVAPRAEVLAQVRAPDYDPRRSVLLETAPPGWPGSAPGGTVDRPLPARELGPGHWEVETPGEDDGLVVLSESWNPDWHAFDGEGASLPVLRAEGLFLAVPVRRGIDHIAIRYIPRAVQRGAVVSLATGLLVLAAGFVLRRRRVAGFPSELRAQRHPLAAGFALGAALVAGVCTLAGVGGSGVERVRTSLPAAAARSWSGEAFAAYQAGAPAEAVRLLQSATRADPTEAAYAYRLGLAQRKVGRTEEARSAFRRALEIDSQFTPATEALRDIDANAE